MSLIVVVQNDGHGTEHNSSYVYQVQINERVIERGYITGHDRDLGWRPLVQMVASGNYALKHKIRGVNVADDPNIGR